MHKHFTLHQNALEPVHLPDSAQGCRERMAALQGEIASIRIQIATTDIRRQTEKKTLDAAWFHRAKTALRLKQQKLAQVPGGRVGEWVSEAEEGTSYRTEHFRTVDSLGLLMRNGAITAQMHDVGQDFSRIFVFAQLSSAGSPPLDRIPGGHWQDTMTERCAWARKRLGQALDAVGGIGSPGGCAVWHVAGLGQSVREWSAQEGWNGRTLNQYEAKGILVGALGVLAVHYGYSR